jgi:hypothetical protein
VGLIIQPFDLSNLRLFSYKNRRREHMKKITSLKITNVILLILFLCQATTGLAHPFIGDESFEILHPSVGVLLIITGIVHIVLNWGWVKSNFSAS